MKTQVKWMAWSLLNDCAMPHISGNSKEEVEGIIAEKILFKVEARQIALAHPDLVCTEDEMKFLKNAKQNIIFNKNSLSLEYWGLNNDGKLVDVGPTQIEVSR